MQRPSANRWSLVGWGGTALWTALTLFLIAVTAASFLVARNARRDHVLSIGLQTSIGLQRVLRNAGPPAGADRLQAILQRFEAPDVFYVEVVTGSGHVIAGTSNRPLAAPSAAAVLATLQHGEAVVVDSTDALDRTVFDVYVPLRQPRPGMRRGFGRPPPNAEPPPGDPSWGFRPGQTAVRVGIDAAPAQWLTRWAWAQAAASLLAILALGLVILRSRRTARALLLLEDQRRRREVMARLGEVSAVLAHEIRNPLAALKGHVQLAAEQVDRGPSPSDLAVRLDIAIDEAERVEDLVRGLLDYARDRVLSLTPVYIAQVLRDAVAAVDSALGPYPGLDVDCPDDLVAELDLDQAARAVANLVQNAREAGGPEGKIRLSATESGADIIVLVEDSGPGVPEPLHERLFDPFVTGKVRGIGLGLAIVTQVVEAHGGNVAADRSPSLGGARFAIRFPLRAQAR